MSSAAHYRGLLDGERAAIRALCDAWQATLDDAAQRPGIPDEVCGRIQIAIGQAQLLMRKKFEQFRSLIAVCEEGTSDRKVTVEDLQGFWDMMYIQVEDIHKKFSEVEDMKNNNWEQPPAKTEIIQMRQPLKNLNKAVVDPHSKLTPRVGTRDLAAEAKERLAQAKALARKRRLEQIIQ